MKALRMTNDLRCKTFRQVYLRRKFAEPEKHSLCRLCSLLITFASHKGLSAISLPSNSRTFYSEINLTLNCEMSSVKVVLGDNSPRWQLSGWQLFWVAIVLGGSCPRWQLSGWQLSRWL